MYLVEYQTKKVSDLVLYLLPSVERVSEGTEPGMRNLDHSTPLTLQERNVRVWLMYLPFPGGDDPAAILGFGQAIVAICTRSTSLMASNRLPKFSSNRQTWSS